MFSSARWSILRGRRFFRLVVLGLYTKCVPRCVCVHSAALSAPEKHGIFLDCENDIIQSLDFELLNGGIKWLEKSNLCRAIGGSCRGSRIDELYGRSEAAFLCALPLETLVC